MVRVKIGFESLRYRYCCLGCFFFAKMLFRLLNQWEIAEEGLQRVVLDFCFLFF